MGACRSEILARGGQPTRAALGIIIDIIYTQENRIKDFSSHYSKANQERKNLTPAIEEEK